MERWRPYSMRKLGNSGSRLDLPLLKDLVHALFLSFQEKGYFQEWFGYHCVDSGHLDGRAGSNVAAFFFRRLRKRDLWPLHDNISSYSEEDLFDVIELLHQCVSKPVDGYYHSFANCGFHASTFDQQVGREEFRSELNDALGDYSEGYELSPNGEVQVKGEVGLGELLNAKLPEPKVDAKNVEQKIEAAIAKFRRRQSSIDDRRDAVRSLADVLEFLRPRMKEVLSEKDENDLFNLANNFAIRHHNERQKTKYDQQIWLSWMFYFYLATIHAVIRRLRLGEANSKLGSQPGVAS